METNRSVNTIGMLLMAFADRIDRSLDPPHNRNPNQFFSHLQMFHSTAKPFLERDKQWEHAEKRLNNLQPRENEYREDYLKRRGYELYGEICSSLVRMGIWSEKETPRDTSNRLL